MKQFLFLGENCHFWGQITPELIELLPIFTKMDHLDHLYRFIQMMQMKKKRIHLDKSIYIVIQMQTLAKSHPKPKVQFTAKKVFLLPQLLLGGSVKIQSNPSIPPILGLAKKRRYSENGGIYWESYITYKKAIWDLEMGGGIGRDDCNGLKHWVSMTYITYDL